MAGVPRMELEELFAKYSKHPDLLDIYVEGNFDRDLLRFLLDEMGYGVRVSVYTIDSVDVSDGIIASFGLNHGSNKHRLMALAQSLASQNFPESNVSCFVDADADRLLGKVLFSRHLVYTDYTCMEMYCVNIDCLRKFFVLVCNLSEESLDEFLGLAGLILPVQFALRAASESLELNAAIPPFRSGLGKEKGKGKEVFTAGKYLNSYIDREKLHGKKGEVEEKFYALIAELEVDLRHKINGHDFIQLLFEYIAGSGVLKFHGKAEEVEKRGGRILSSSLVAAKVFTEGVFKNLEMAISGDKPMWPVVNAGVAAASC